ncbi:MAG: Cna B-type domain-containing protein [Eubacteriales bacterium]|nr:Cna B-type domain-containing protein [Eubacteriales bacterium]
MQKFCNKQFLKNIIISVTILVLIVLSVPFPAAADEGDLTNQDEGLVEGGLTSQDEGLSVIEAENKENSQEPLTVTVKMHTTINLVTNGLICTGDDVYIFNLNGKEYSATGIVPVKNDDYYVFEYKFEGVSASAEDTDLKLDHLSTTHPEYDPTFSDVCSVVSSSYDSVKHELNVELGRNLHILISPLRNTNFDNLANTYTGEDGFVVELYTTENKSIPIQTVGITTTKAGYKIARLTGLIPGKYYLKISSSSDTYKNYDFSKFYGLTIENDGTPKLEMYQCTDYGSKETQYNDALVWGMEAKYAGPALYQGYKSQMFLFIAKNNPVEKVVLDSSEAKSDMEVYKNDIVTFQLKKKISPDHKTVLYTTGFYKGIFNCGTYCDQSFSDILDDRLEYVDGSLQVTLDGKATSEYVAKYEENERKIVVEDNSKPNIIEFDDSTTAVLPEPQELIVTFKVKVLEAVDTIYNTVDESTVTLIPFKVEGHKIWQDQDNQENKRPESIVVRLLANGVEVANKTVTANEDWSWSFVDLPRVDDAGNLINYSLQEDPVTNYESEVNGYDIINTYTPETPPPTHPTEPTIPDEPTSPPTEPTSPTTESTMPRTEQVTRPTAPKLQQVKALPRTGERSYAPVIAVSLISLAIIGFFRKNHGSY